MKIEEYDHPMEYFVFLNRKCPYCRERLKLINSKLTWSNNAFSFLICLKCERIFKINYSQQKKAIGVVVKQLTKNQSEVFMKFKSKEVKRLRNGRNRK